MAGPKEWGNHAACPRKTLSCKTASTAASDDLICKADIPGPDQDFSQKETDPRQNTTNKGFAERGILPSYRVGKAIATTLPAIQDR